MSADGVYTIKSVVFTSSIVTKSTTTHGQFCGGLNVENIRFHKESTALYDRPRGNVQIVRLQCEPIGTVSCHDERVTLHLQRVHVKQASPGHRQRRHTLLEIQRPTRQDQVP